MHHVHLCRFIHKYPHKLIYVNMLTEQMDCVPGREDSSLYQYFQNFPNKLLHWHPCLRVFLWEHPSCDRVASWRKRCLWKLLSIGRMSRQSEEERLWAVEAPQVFSDFYTPTPLPNTKLLYIHGSQSPKMSWPTMILHNERVIFKIPVVLWVWLLVQYQHYLGIH